MEALAPVRALDAPDAVVRLEALARSDAPVRRVVAALAGRLVAAKGWDRLGYVRLRDYAVERLGLSARQVQDLAHVDRALRELPRVDAAFVAGEITWTKARLLCRMATAEDEEVWLELAKSLTARALSREVRRVDARALEAAGVVEIDEDGAEELPRETVWLHVTPRVRARWGRARLLARQVAGEALSQAQAAEAIAAEVLSALGADADPGIATPLHFRDAAGRESDCKFSRTEPKASEDHQVGERIPPRAAGAPSAKPSPHSFPKLPAFLARLLDNLESVDAIELDARLRRALRIEQRLLSEMAPLLLESARSRAHRSRGFSNLAAYARERLGMSPRRAQALVRLERAGELCPELRAAFRSGELSWVQAHALVPVLSLEHAQPWRAAWVSHANSITVRRLEDDVERAIATGQLDPISLSSAAVQTGAHSTVRRETIHLFFTAPADVARLFRGVLATVQRRIERRNGHPVSESEALDEVLEHCFAAWSPGHAKVPPEHRVFERDGWRCTVPGCTSYRNLHSHHIVFRSDDGPDDDWNRTALCAAHHHRCVHEGLGRIRIRGRAPDALRFEMPLVTYGPGERIVDQG